MNRVSGKALVQHTRRSDLSSYEFIDGFGSCLSLLGEMFADMVPTVMDTERVERIIGLDGVEKMITVNQEQPGNPNGDLINDLRQGSYDVVCVLGPSYQTARQENLDTLISVAEKIPQAQALIGDLIVKNVDSPDTDEMVRRMRIPLIQQGLVQPNAQEKQNMPPPPKPNPMQQAELARAQALAQKDAAAAQSAMAKAQMGPVESHRLIVESAGKHLANILLAQQIAGTDAETVTRRAEAAAAEGESEP
jgi:hypothetical protein